MTITKKLVPLSFSIPVYRSQHPGELDLNYTFPSFPVIGKQNLTFQLVYQDLDTSNMQIRLEQSLDNSNFDDFVDYAGDPVIMTLSKDHTSLLIMLSNINTAFIRCKLILNTNTLGSLTNYIYLTS